MIPVLPSQDKDPATRQAQLEKAREKYEFDYSYYAVCWIKKLPFEDNYPLKDMGKLVAWELDWFKDLGKWLLDRGTHNFLKSITGVIGGLFQHDHDEDHRHTLYGRAKKEIEDNLPQDRPATEEEYRSVFTTIPEWEITKHYKEDWCFAYQRVVGPVPDLLQRISKLPDNFPVTEEHYRQALGDNGSLEAALREGRAFMVDHKALDGYGCGTAFGHQKYLYQPISLYVSVPGHAKYELVPVAIQCGQKPGPQHPIYTPKDGVHWRAAKFAVQVADANYHTNIGHFALCHTLSEALVLAYKRTLADNHPLGVLLKTHFQYTLASNDVIKRFFATSGGSVDVLMSPTLSETMRMVKKAMDEFDFNKETPPGLFERNNTTDKEGLAMYPFRDDSVRQWDILLDFVNKYVNVYYESDADVVADSEVQDFVNELQSQQGARLHGVGDDGKVETRSVLARLVTQIIWRVGTYHNALNYCTPTTVSMAPNMSYAGFGPVPLPDNTNPQEALMQMYPPWKHCWYQFESTWGQLGLYENQIGVYPNDLFKDDRVKPLLADLSNRMDELNAAIEEENKSRPVEYILGMPHKTTASVMA